VIQRPTLYLKYNEDFWNEFSQDQFYTYPIYKYLLENPKLKYYGEKRTLTKFEIITKIAYMLSSQSFKVPKIDVMPLIDLISQNLPLINLKEIKIWSIDSLFEYLYKLDLFDLCKILAPFISDYNYKDIVSDIIKYESSIQVPVKKYAEVLNLDMIKLEQIIKDRFSFGYNTINSYFDVNTRDQNGTLIVDIIKTYDKLDVMKEFLKHIYFHDNFTYFNLQRLEKILNTFNLILPEDTFKYSYGIVKQIDNIAYYFNGDKEILSRLFSKYLKLQILPNDIKDKIKDKILNTPLKRKGSF